MWSVLKNICLIVQRGQSSGYWNSLMSDSKAAAFLYQTDHHVAELQQIMQSHATSRVSFASSVLFFISRICTAEDHNLILSYARTTLEIFILYSITTSNFDWVLDTRAGQICRRLESLSLIGFHKSQLPPATEYLGSVSQCLQASAHLKALSHLQHHQAEIVDALIGLAEVMPSDRPLTLYNHSLRYHQQNAAVFIKKLRSRGHYWIGMAYCLAIEPARERREILGDRLYERPTPCIRRISGNEALRADFLRSAKATCIDR